MAGIRIVGMLLMSFLFFQKAFAGVDEPLPAIQDLFVSDYEQRIFLSVVQNKEPDAFQLLLAGAAEMDHKKEMRFRTELSSFVQKMEKKKENISSDKIFLQKLFYKVHRKFLKEYKPYKSYYSLLESGEYNCLSGTALYALLLDEFGYSYTILETDYHIFLLVKTGDGDEILVESTDPLNGFLADKEEIKQRVEDIKQDVLVAGKTNGKDYYDFNLEVFRPVTLKQLAGLQYFNQAAHQYNNRHLAQAEIAIAKGRILYQAERFDQFARFLENLK